MMWLSPGATVLCVLNHLCSPVITFCDLEKYLACVRTRRAVCALPDFVGEIAESKRAFCVGVHANSTIGWPPPRAVAVTMGAIIGKHKVKTSPTRAEVPLELVALIYLQARPQERADLLIAGCSFDHE